MLRILLIEDDADQRQLYHDVMTDAGYEVTGAQNAVEALEILERCKPDIVVLDIQMPCVDGIEVLGRILSKDKKLPVILHSAYPAYKANYMTWPADAFVVKSGNANELADCVQRVLKVRGAIVQPASESQESIMQCRLQAMSAPPNTWQDG